MLKHGKHVASAVPAVFGSIEQADQLFEAVFRGAQFDLAGVRHVMRSWAGVRGVKRM